MSRSARNDCKKEVDAFLDALLDWQDGLYQDLGKLRDEEGAAGPRSDARGTDQGDDGPEGHSRQARRAWETRPTRRERRSRTIGCRRKSAPHWIGVKTDGFDLITVLSDGTLGPRISLGQVFEEFAKQIVGVKEGVTCANLWSKRSGGERGAMNLMSRIEVRRALVRAFARAGQRVGDVVIDEMVEQLVELRDFYKRKFARLQKYLRQNLPH